MAELEAVGLSQRDLDEDLETIGATYAWLGRRGARLVVRGGGAAVRGTRRIGGALMRRLRR